MHQEYGAEGSSLISCSLCLFNIPSLLMSRYVVFPNTHARACPGTTTLQAVSDARAAPPQVHPDRAAVMILRPPHGRSAGAGQASDSHARVRLRTRLGSFISGPLTTETRRETRRKDSVMCRKSCGGRVEMTAGETRPQRRSEPFRGNRRGCGENRAQELWCVRG